MNKYLLHLKTNTTFGLRLLLYLLRHPKYSSIALRNLRQIKDITLTHKIPWLTYESINWLEQYLKKDMLVFEWGSGGSTIFLATRTSQVISVEHHKDWYEKVLAILTSQKINNYQLHLIEPVGRSDYTTYAGLINHYPDNNFDLVLIDGQARNECIATAIPKIKSGGVLILDNSERSEYETGKTKLASWPKITYYGPGAYNHYFWQTTIFFKP